MLAHVVAPKTHLKACSHCRDPFMNTHTHTSRSTNICISTAMCVFKGTCTNTCSIHVDYFEIYIYMYTHNEHVNPCDYFDIYLHRRKIRIHISV